MTGKECTTAWKSSSKARKQRKFLRCAPAHSRRAFLSAHLSKQLRQQYKRRAVPLRVGDKVKIMRGANAGKKGAVERVDACKIAIFVTGIDRALRDGRKQLLPLSPSNLLIEELELKDRRRIDSLKQERPRKSPAEKAAPKTAEPKKIGPQ